MRPSWNVSNRARPADRSIMIETKYDKIGDVAVVTLATGPARSRLRLPASGQVHPRCGVSPARKPRHAVRSRPAADPGRAEVQPEPRRGRVRGPLTCSPAAGGCWLPGGLAAELGARVPAGFQARDHVAAAGGVRVEASEYQPYVFDLEQEQMLVAHRDAAGGQGVRLHRDDDGVACVDDLVGVVAEIPPFLTPLFPTAATLHPPSTA